MYREHGEFYGLIAEMQNEKTREVGNITKEVDKKAFF